MAIEDILYRIFYSTSFTFAFLVLLAVCAVTPADTLYQSYKRHRLIDIFIITGAYVLTGLIAIFLYSSRLYTNRSVLRDIPKTFLPIDRDDLPNRRVWVLIQDRLARAAVAAYHATPRARRIEVEHPIAGERILLVTKQVKHRHHLLFHQSYGRTGQSRLNEDEKKLLEPKWGDVEHPGWRSPAAKDMPGLEYDDVVNQLVDLVEANAVTLCSSPEDDALAAWTTTLVNDDKDNNNNNNNNNNGDEDKRKRKKTTTMTKKEQAIDLVTRPEHFGMRQYMAWLTQLGVVPDDSATEYFIRAYERARFAERPLSTSEFDDLMRRFAELLRSMKPLEAGDLFDLLHHHHNDEDDEDDGDKDVFLSPSSTPPPPPHHHPPSTSSHHHLPPSRISEDSAAPSMSEDEDDGSGNSHENLPARSTSQRKKVVPQPRKRLPRRPSRKSPPAPPPAPPPLAAAEAYTASPASTRSRSTMTQGSHNGSVIRLRLRRRRRREGGDDGDDSHHDHDDDNDDGDELLPYTIEVGGRKQDQGKS